MRPKDGMEFFLDKPLYAHPRFSFEYNPEVIPTFGNSVPVLVAATMWQPTYPNYSGLLPLYFGRLGEYMEPDLYAGWTEVNVDGEKIFGGNMQELIAWSSSEFSLPKHSGKYTFTIEDDCPMVDGKEGFNRTVIKTDASGSDREAPTLTMLNFRNSLDKITDRFNEPADGTLEFSAADLNSAVNDFGIKWFAVDSPASVKVEYAPEDSEDFRKLEATEIPEFYFEPCFGSFYRAPLEAISSYSPSGWYKLRLTVADAAGNTQEQTISPAFHIDNLSSINEVSNDSSINREGNVFSADGMISLYDTTGRLLKSGKGTLSADGLHGVFIVKAAGKSLKVIL